MGGRSKLDANTQLFSVGDLVMHDRGSVESLAERDTGNVTSVSAYHLRVKTLDERHRIWRKDHVTNLDHKGDRDELATD
jgi:hypothetical protein